MDETQARQYYIILQTLQEQLKQLHEHLEEVDEKTAELNNMINAVKDTKEFTDEQDILVPLTNGVMIPATTNKPKKLYLNVGASTVIEKTPAEALKMLEEQEQELDTYRQKIVAQHEALHKQHDELARQITGAVEDV